MHWLSLTASALLLAAPATCFKASHKPGNDAILLSNVQTLTLRADRLTTSRRVSPIPQLSCTGPSKKICDLYKVETMRCKNDGYDYDAEDVQWTCTASLPPEFKLGATDVVCEGYRNANDKWVLKGSCGVEYRMLLTDQGEKRFGKVRGDHGMPSWLSSAKRASGFGFRKTVETLENIAFFGIIIVVFLSIFGPMIANCLGIRRNWRGGRARRQGWGGFFGGGGGGGGGRHGDDYPQGPPPPYDSGCADDRNWRFTSRNPAHGWTPGFWTGALGGAAAGYQMGRRANNAEQRSSHRGSFTSYDSYDPGEGSSGNRSQFHSSTTSTSTGFGSTRRR